MARRRSRPSGRRSIRLPGRIFDSRRIEHLGPESPSLQEEDSEREIDGDVDVIRSMMDNCVSRNSGRIIQGTFLSVMLIPSQVLILPLFLLLTRIGPDRHVPGPDPGLRRVQPAVRGVLPHRDVPGDPGRGARRVRVDGAGFFRTVWSIITPMGSSGIATLAVLQFLAMWNELLLALVLMPGDLKLLTPTLASIGNRFENNQPLVSAGLFFSAIVPMLMLAFASRYIMRGLAVGVSR